MKNHVIVKGRNSKYFVIGLIILLLTLIFVACGGSSTPSHSPAGSSIGKPVVLGIRPEHVIGDKECSTNIEMVVRSIEPLGPHTFLIGTVGGSKFTAQMPAEIKVEPDDTVTVSLDLPKAHLFDKQTGRTILDGSSSMTK